jgi:ribulose bisphosphate carboxylase small subunit
LLTPPGNNPLKPYGLGKRDAQLADSNGHSEGSIPRPSFKAAQLPEPIGQTLQAILAQGHRLGIEHVDQRRFRINSWQSYATLDSTNSAEAIDKVRSCLTQFPEHYVRLISIDQHTHRRMSETVVQRPL